jgi:hypothetical protein
MDRDLETLIAAMQLPSDADRKRDALIGRFASALEDMSETHWADYAMRLEAVGWKDREDFEQLLDDWETACNATLRGAD